MGLSSSKTKSSSKSSGTATTTPNVPSWISGPAQNYYGQVNSLMNGSTPTTIGPSANQTAAFSGASVLSGPNAGVTEGANATRGLLNFTPDEVQAGQLRDTDLNPYMNPWLNDVVGAAAGDIERARAEAISAGQGAATTAGAYGGSRHGVADSLTNEAALRTLASTSAGLRSQGFQTAQQAALADITNRLGADTSNADRGLAGAGLRLGAANQAANIGLAGDDNTRQNLVTQAGLGGMERDIAQENDPQNAQINRLRQIAQLLGINPEAFIGQTINQSSRSSGTQTQGTSGLDWLNAISNFWGGNSASAGG